MLAIAGDLCGISSVLAILAAIFFAFRSPAIASWMCAYTFWFVGHGVSSVML
jgi:hypothetical protein